MLPKSKWVQPFNTPAQTALRFFCFPYAGGAAQIYKDWHTHLPANVQVCGIQYPGRSSRFTEPLVQDPMDYVNAMRREIKPFLDKPFVIFGHSMGSMIAYELTRALQEDGFAPRRLLVSGRGAPHCPKTREDYHPLPDGEFREKIKDMNGTPPEVLEHEELMDLMIPILRADFRVSETYEYKPGVMLRCGLTAFGGKGDPDVPEERLSGWTEHTEGDADYHMMEGDHFFLHDQKEEMLKLALKKIFP